MILIIYLWPKMALKMSQEFPTVSLDVTKSYVNVWLAIRKNSDGLWLFPKEEKEQAESMRVLFFRSSLSLGQLLC